MMSFSTIVLSMCYGLYKVVAKKELFLFDEQSNSNQSQINENHNNSSLVIRRNHRRSFDFEYDDSDIQFTLKNLINFELINSLLK